jgi:hypothetical protein
MSRLRRISSSKGGLVTFGTIIGLLAALGVTLFGLGATNHALAGSNASAWMWSTNKGEIARVNGETGKVDTRFKVVDAQGHVIQVSQSDRYLMLRDLTTGKVSSLDLATLQISATTNTTAGLGVTIALSGESAFIIDAVQGVIRQLDPIALTPVGEPLHFPPGIAGGTFDGAGTLWLVIPTEGTVVGVHPAKLHPSKGAPSSPPAANPVVAKTVPVTDPGHDLSMSTLDSGVAVLDETATTLTTVRDDQPHRVKLPLSGNGKLPTESTPDSIPVTVIDDRHVYVVNGTKVTDFTVPGTGELEPAVPFAGRLYVADNSTGTVYVLDADGKLVSTIAIPNAGGDLELAVRGDHLFINCPNSNAARVVDNKNHVKSVDKYANDILGGDPPPAPPPPPPPKQPTVGPPGAPTRVTATAGNTTAHVTWGPANPNGSPVTQYVVEGDGQAPHVLGASQRAIDLTGLTNGQTYTFTVYAVNAKGNGPKGRSNPVMPSSAVPDPPVSVTARENTNGTVTISWPAANGQGHPVPRYDITQVSAGAQQPLASANGTSFTTAAGQLTLGTQYAFTVTSINDKGSASKPSPLSNTVVPYAPPGAPPGLRALTGPGKGQLAVAWQVAANNGRAVTGYQVTANGGAPQTVTGATSVTLSGFADNTPVTVVVRAVNPAGPGAPATTTARTMAPPTITGGNPGASGYNGINVPFTTNNGGGNLTCTISVNGGGASGVGCSGTTVGGLWPGNTYNFTVTATNAAGSARFSGSVATPAMFGTVICPNNTGGYCNSGIWTYRSATQSGTAVRALAVGYRFRAECWTTGGNVNAAPYGGKNNNIWIRFTGNGTEYFPDAWTRLDGGDNTNNLPHC